MRGVWGVQPSSHDRVSRLCNYHYHVHHCHNNFYHYHVMSSTRKLGPTVVQPLFVAHAPHGPHCWRMAWLSSFCHTVFESSTFQCALSSSSASWRHYLQIDVLDVGGRFISTATTPAVMTNCKKSSVLDMVLYQTSLGSPQRSRVRKSAPQKCQGSGASNPGLSGVKADSLPASGRPPQDSHLSPVHIVRPGAAVIAVTVVM